MSTEDICNELYFVSEQERIKIEESLPENLIERFILFIETIRVYDLLAVSTKAQVEEYIIKQQEFDIIRTGWNLGASYLYKSLNVEGLPIIESTPELRSYIISLLYRLGCTLWVKRVIQMVKSGALSVIKADTTYTFKRAGFTNKEHLDLMEFVHLQNLEDKLNKVIEGYYNEWTFTDTDRIEDVSHKVGNFLGKSSKTEFDKFLSIDIDPIMEKLVYPWDSGRGIMLGYGAEPEIDNYFLAKALLLVKSWREDAGIHPGAKLGEVVASDVCTIVTFLVSLHMKHVHFVMLASKRFPEVSIPQSLTIWEPLENLKNSLADYSGMATALITKVLRVVMIKEEDVFHLKKHTYRFMPLLIDLGNGYVLRPVSSLSINPFFTIISLLEFRNPSIRHEISKHRENWLRSNTYALFTGTRYQRVEGNVILRNGKMAVTDIDAVIYDNLTGDLALFQLKWQDFFTNDVNKLHSKASNLTRELDEWAERVTHWVDNNGVSALVKNLRLKTTKEVSASSIYLFGLSRNSARMKGYGFDIKSTNLAVTNWPQFVRNRIEIGPANSVIYELFETTKTQESDVISIKALPTTMHLADKVMVFEDLWSIVGS